MQSHINTYTENRYAEKMEAHADFIYNGIHILLSRWQEPWHDAFLILDKS